MSEGYRVFDHTADIGIEAWGEDLPAVFRLAAVALFDAAVDVASVEPRETEQVRVEADGPEMLLKEWLSELLFRFCARGRVFRTFEITDLTGSRLTATARGESYDARRHRLKTDLKAVTYHGLSVIREGPLWRARCIIDV